MPRRKSPAPDAPPIPESRPDDMPPEVWNLGKRIGNMAQADDLLAVANGERPARDVGESVALLDVSRKLESQSLAKYSKLRAGLGRQLSDAENEYREHAERTSRLVRTLSDPAALMAPTGTDQNGSSENL